jgi:hypothetical protein
MVRGRAFGRTELPAPDQRRERQASRSAVRAFRPPPELQSGSETDAPGVGPRMEALSRWAAL